MIPGIYFRISVAVIRIVYVMIPKERLISVMLVSSS